MSTPLLYPFSLSLFLLSPSLSLSAPAPPPSLSSTPGKLSAPILALPPFARVDEKWGGWMRDGFLAAASRNCFTFRIYLKADFSKLL